LRLSGSSRHVEELGHESTSEIDLGDDGHCRDDLPDGCDYGSVRADSGGGFGACELTERSGINVIGAHEYTKRGTLNVFYARAISERGSRCGAHATCDVVADFAGAGFVTAGTDDWRVQCKERRARAEHR